MNNAKEERINENDNKNYEGLITRFLLIVAFFSCCAFGGRLSNPANINSNSTHTVMMLSAKMIGNHNVNAVKGNANQAKTFYKDNKEIVKEHPICKKSMVLVPLFAGLQKGATHMTNMLLKF